MAAQGHLRIKTEDRLFKGSLNILKVHKQQGPLALNMKPTCISTPASSIINLNFIHTNIYQDCLETINAMVYCPVTTGLYVDWQF